MKVNPGSALHKLLLALRPGPMDATAIRERFPTTNMLLAPWVRSGLIQPWGESSYSITDAGRAACPLRIDFIKAPRDARGTYKRKKPSASVAVRAS